MVTVDDADGVVFTPSGFETVSSFLTSASTFFTFFLVSGELSFLIFGFFVGGAIWFHVAFGTISPAPPLLFSTPPFMGVRTFPR